MKKVLCVLSAMIALFVSEKASAQEFIGLRTDNYSGSNGMLLNPAMPISGALSWDVNIAAIGVSGDNNYVYAPNQSVLSLARNSDNVEVNYNDVSRVSAHENVLLQLPSAFKRINDFAFGIFITGRNAGYVTSSHYPNGINSLQDVPIGQPTTIPQFTAGVLNWSEIGINGEIALQENSFSALYIGGNLKYLMGFDALDFQNNTDFTFTKTQNNSTIISNIDAQYAYTENLGSNAISDPANYHINGGGVGADFGVVYELRNNAHTDYKNPIKYNWKFAASLVDLGFIHFKKNAGTYELYNQNQFTASTTDLDSISDVGEFNKIGSRTLYDNGRASQTGDDFSVLLPTAITLSADKNLGKGFFVNGLVVRRLPQIHASLLSRANIIAVTPRYEKKWFGLSLPVVLYEDRDLHVGTAARIGFLTIGSDNVLSFVQKKELSGTDFYAGIKINPFWLNKTDHRAKQIDCPKVWN